MAMEFSDRTFSSGEVYLYILGSGRISIADCEGLVEQLERPEFGGRAKVMSVTAKGTEYPADVRRFLYTDPFRYRAMANVVNSPIIRATINMMLRLAPGQDKYRMFNDETSAMEWLLSRP